MSKTTNTNTKGKSWYSWAARIHHMLGAIYYTYKVALTMSGVGVLYSIIEFYHTQPQISLIGYIVSLPSLGLFVWCVYVWLESNRKQLASYNPGLVHREVENTYTIKNKKSYVYAKQVTVKPLYTGINLYKHKFWWPKDGEIISKPDNPKDKIDVYPDHRSPKTVCDVKLGKPLNRKEYTVIAYKLFFAYVKEPPPPYFYHISCVPIEKLIMRVIFPEHLNITAYRRQVFLNISADVPMWEEAVSLGLDAKEAIFEVIRPIPDLCYKISWSP